MPHCVSRLTRTPLSAAVGLRISYRALFTNPSNVGDIRPAVEGTGNTSKA